MQNATRDFEQTRPLLSSEDALETREFPAALAADGSREGLLEADVGENGFGGPAPGARAETFRRIVVPMLVGFGNGLRGALSSAAALRPGKRIAGDFAELDVEVLERVLRHVETEDVTGDAVDVAMLARKPA